MPSPVKFTPRMPIFGWPAACYLLETMGGERNGLRRAAQRGQEPKTKSREKGTRVREERGSGEDRKKEGKRSERRRGRQERGRAGKAREERTKEGG